MWAGFKKLIKNFNDNLTFKAADLLYHFVKIEEDINKAIPDENYTGLAIIDYEGWRPIYDLNYSSRRVYQKYSRQLVSRQCENCTETEVNELSKKWFEMGAKFVLNCLFE